MFISFDSYLDSQVENILSTLFASCAASYKLYLSKREKRLWKINLNWIKSKKLKITEWIENELKKFFLKEKNC